jgi:cytochrome c-type biogenesis protein CcmH
MIRRLGLVLCLILSPLLVALPAYAVQPDEMLSDPVLEARAREISRGLRCLVCRNEAIDESNAALAHDLRLLVRERILAGDSDEQVVAFIVDRYGEYVLLQPRASGSTLILWVAGPAMLLGALGIGFVYLSRRRGAAEPIASLTRDEARRLEEILKQ